MAVRTLDNHKSALVASANRALPVEAGLFELVFPRVPLVISAPLLGVHVSQGLINANPSR
jgi:hypothetical protein